jgi:hypothetical protein
MTDRHPSIFDRAPPGAREWLAAALREWVADQQDKRERRTSSHCCGTSHRAIGRLVGHLEGLANEYGVIGDGLLEALRLAPDVDEPPPVLR